MMFITSQKGIDFIKSFEGCVLTAYQDAVGIWTIGYGHTSDVHSGMTITLNQAEAYLKSDLKKFENSVNSCVTVNLTQNMYNALVSFAFNVGVNALKGSTLLTLLNQDHIYEAAEEFNKWIFADKKILPGLIKRRAAEKEMFLDGIWVNEKDFKTTKSSNRDTIKGFQTWLNSTYDSKLVVDGVFGELTKIATLNAFQTCKFMP